MNLLKNELIKLDGEIDASIPVNLLRKLRLDQLLSHLLMLVEVGEKTGRINNLDLGAVDVAVQWGVKHCTSSKPKSVSLRYEPFLFDLAVQIYHEARNYRTISVIMRHLFKRKLQGTRNGNQIETQLVAEFDAGIAAAEHEYFSSGDPTYVYPNRKDLDKLITTCKPIRVGDKKLRFKMPPELFSKVLELTRGVVENEWLTGLEHELGAYTLGEFLHFSECLAAYAQIHSYVHIGSPLSVNDIDKLWMNSLLKGNTREGWINLMTRLSGVCSKKVSLILQDKTRNLNGIHKSGKTIDLINTPFVEVSPDFLVLSNRLAYVINVERNLWKFLSITNQSAHRQLSNTKEALQIKDIRKIFEQHAAQDILLFPNIDVDAKKTDIDLLILDLPNEFGLALQLKWPYGPAHIREFQTVWDEFDEAVDKLESIVLPWLRSIPQAVVDRTHISAEKLSRFRFEALLLSKNTLGFGWLNCRNDIPISSQRFLKWCCKDRRLSPKTFWDLASSYAYKPTEYTHYKRKTTSAVLGQLKFTAPIAFEMLKELHPETDIPWSKLVV